MKAQLFNSHSVISEPAEASSAPLGTWQVAWDSGTKVPDPRDKPGWPGWSLCLPTALEGTRIPCRKELYGGGAEPGTCVLS